VSDWDVETDLNKQPNRENWLSDSVERASKQMISGRLKGGARSAPSKSALSSRQLLRSLWYYEKQSTRQLDASTVQWVTSPDRLGLTQRAKLGCLNFSRERVEENGMMITLSQVDVILIRVGKKRDPSTEIISYKRRCDDIGAVDHLFFSYPKSCNHEHNLENQCCKFRVFERSPAKIPAR
jgi:hypothetical protein